MPATELTMIYEDAQRLAVFVDVEDLTRAARTKGGGVKFDELLDGVAGGRPLVRAIAYLDRGRRDAPSLHKLLGDCGFEVRGESAAADQGNGVGKFSVNMALDAAAISARVDAVALVSPAPQLLGLVKYLKFQGVRVEVWGFAGDLRADVAQEADEFLAIPPDIVEMQRPAREPAVGRTGGAQPEKPKQQEPQPKQVDDFVAGIFDD